MVSPIVAIGAMILAPLAASHATFFPFVASAPLIPFQRLGRAAMLGITAFFGGLTLLLLARVRRPG